MAPINQRAREALNSQRDRKDAEALQILAGERGDPLDWAVRQRDIVDIKNYIAGLMIEDAKQAKALAALRAANNTIIGDAVTFGVDTTVGGAGWIDLISASTTALTGTFANWDLSDITCYAGIPSAAPGTLTFNWKIVDDLANVLTSGTGTFTFVTLDPGDNVLTGFDVPNANVALPANGARTFTLQIQRSGGTVLTLSKVRGKISGTSS